MFQIIGGEYIVTLVAAAAAAAAGASRCSRVHITRIGDAVTGNEIQLTWLACRCAT